MSLSRVRLFVSSWTIQSMELSRPEYWTGYPFPSPGDLPNPGIKSRSPTLQADSLPAEPPGKPWSESHSVVSDSLRPHGLCIPWNSSGQDTGVGGLCLPQGIFPTQGSNPGLPHCKQILYRLSHKGSPGILEWVAYPFSSRSSWPRNQTSVSCIAVDSLPTELSGKPNSMSAHQQ